MTNKNRLIKQCLPGLLLSLALACSTSAFAADSGGDSDWQYSGTVYLWGANITANTPRSDTDPLPFYKLLDNQQMAFMGVIEARNDKWAFNTDVIYMDVKARNNDPVTGPGGGSFDARRSVELKSWVVTPTIRYTLSETEKARFEFVTGLRYTYIDTAANIHVEDESVLDKQVSGANWDAIIGARSIFHLNEKWYIPLYADIGTGTSDRTWQALAGIGYRFSKVDATLAYRYLDYKFDDHQILADMTMKGPVAGFTFYW